MTYFLTHMEHVRKHYNNQDYKGTQERVQTANYAIRKINNRIKTSLINEYLEKYSDVLDLACGKGGDVRKYCNKYVNFLYGLDCSNISLLEVRNRINATKPDFPSRYKLQDCFGEAFDLERQFDFISCQFSFQYAFFKKEMVDQAIENIVSHLKPNGIFIMTVTSKDVVIDRLKSGKHKNSLHCIKASPNLQYRMKNNVLYDPEKIFENGYSFQLSDSITDCEEWLVDDKYVSDSFYNKNCTKLLDTSFKTYCLDEKALRKSNFLNLYDEYNRLKPEERDVVDIYKIFVFEKCSRRN